VAPRHRSDMPSWGQALSRRRFLRSAAGAAGLVLGSNLLLQAKADGSFDPTPIPGGNYFLGSPGPLFHVYGPGFGGDQTTVDQQPSTITDFDGVIGLAFISGMVTETNTTTGEQRKLPFNDADMRFMQGVFLDTNGQERQGTFALV
jgi:hypothetical protein